MYQVQHVMTKGVVAVHPETSIDEAISIILDHQISGLPVVDQDGQVLGVISEVDIIELVYQSDIASSTVGDHMTREIKTLDVESSLDDAAGLLSQRTLRRIPITEQGRLAGIVSRRDLIRFLRGLG